MPVDGGGGGGELRAASAPSNRQLHVLPCDNAQQHVQLVELGSAITAALAVDEDVALLHRAASHHRHVARLLGGRADRAERLDNQVLAMRPRAGRRVRGAARVGRSRREPRELASADPSELTASESDVPLLRSVAAKVACCLAAVEAGPPLGHAFVLGGEDEWSLLLGQCSWPSAATAGKLFNYATHNAAASP